MITATEFVVIRTEETDNEKSYRVEDRALWDSWQIITASESIEIKGIYYNTSDGVIRIYISGRGPFSIWHKKHKDEGALPDALLITITE